MKDKKSQDEQAEQLILENVNNMESKRISCFQYSWRPLEGSLLTITTKGFGEKVDLESPWNSKYLSLLKVNILYRLKNRLDIAEDLEIKKKSDIQNIKTQWKYEKNDKNRQKNIPWIMQYSSYKKEQTLK